MDRTLLDIDTESIALLDDAVPADHGSERTVDRTRLPDWAPDHWLFEYPIHNDFAPSFPILPMGEHLFDRQTLLGSSVNIVPLDSRLRCFVLVVLFALSSWAADRRLPRIDRHPGHGLRARHLPR